MLWPKQEKQVDIFRYLQVSEDVSHILKKYWLVIWNLPKAYRHRQAPAKPGLQSPGLSHFGGTWPDWKLAGYLWVDLAACERCMWVGLDRAGVGWAWPDLSLVRAELKNLRPGSALSRGFLHPALGPYILSLFSCYNYSVLKLSTNFSLSNSTPRSSYSPWDGTFVIFKKNKKKHDKESYINETQVTHLDPFIDHLITPTTVSIHMFEFPRKLTFLVTFSLKQRRAIST